MGVSAGTRDRLFHVSCPYLEFRCAYENSLSEQKRVAAEMALSAPHRSIERGGSRRVVYPAMFAIRACPFYSGTRASRSCPGGGIRASRTGSGPRRSAIACRGHLGATNQSGPAVGGFPG